MRGRVRGDGCSELELSGIDYGEHCLSCKGPWHRLVLPDGRVNLDDACVSRCGIWRPAKPLPPAFGWRRSKLLVPMPSGAGSTAVRGTLFSILVRPDGAAGLTVAEGTLELFLRDGSGLLLPAGQRADALPGPAGITTAAADPAALAELARWAALPGEDEAELPGGDPASTDLSLGVGPGLTLVAVTAERPGEPDSPPEAGAGRVRLDCRGIVLRAGVGPRSGKRLRVVCEVENAGSRETYVFPAEEIRLVLESGQCLPPDDYRLEHHLLPGQRCQGHLDFVVPEAQEPAGLRFGKGEAAVNAVFSNSDNKGETPR